MNAQTPQRRAPRSLRALLLVTLLSLAALTARGQALNLHVQMPTGKKATLVLTLYDANGTPHRLTAQTRKGEALFTAALSSPCYAELAQSRATQVLPLFLEAGDITVRFDSEQPARSPVTGSRTNSQYRYLLEECGTLDLPCLRHALEAHPDRLFAPLLLYQYLQHNQLPLNEQQALFALLRGEATTGYHYRLLSSRLQQSVSLQPGNPLPNFIYNDADGKRKPIGDHLDRRRANLLLVGATWCSQCNQMAQRIEKQYPQLNLIHLNLDREPDQWDAPYMKTLAIDHIPFLLLLDNEGHILHYDLREWQLDNALPAAPAAEADKQK